MDSIEKQVRIAIGNDFANRAKVVYGAHPAEIAAVLAAEQEYLGTELSKLVESGHLSELEASSLKERISKAERENLSIESLTQRVAMSWMGSSRRELQKFKRIIEVAEELEYELPGDLEKQYDALVAYFQKRDNVVNTLMEKAKADGIESATSVENIRAAVRAEYATPEEYIQSETSLGKIESELFCIIAKLGVDRMEVFHSDLNRKTEAEAREMAEKTVLKADVEAIYKQ